MNYLGIDFGLRHVGLAIADGPLAEPFGEKVNNEGMFKYLKTLIESEKIDKVVIGLPEGEMGRVVMDFGEKLKKISGREVIYRDETLSSKEAKRKLIEAGKPMAKRRHDHSAAAALILQDFIDIMSQGG